MKLASRLSELTAGIKAVDDTTAAQLAAEATNRPPSTAVGKTAEKVGLDRDEENRQLRAKNAIFEGATPLKEIPLDLIDPNPYQPRLIFREDDLAELSENIRCHGVLNPVTVRPGENGRWILVQGERRTRACRLLGMTTIPATLSLDATVASGALKALSENMEREDLTAYEAFRAFQRLINDKVVKNQTELAAKLAIPRSTVSAHFSFAKLPAAALTILDSHPELIGYHTAAQLAAIAEQHAALVVEAVQLLASEVLRRESAVLEWIAKRLRKPVARNVRVFAGASGEPAFELQRTGGRFTISAAKVLPEGAIERLEKSLADMLEDAAKGVA